MFGFFKKDREYYSCEFLETGIHFDIKGLYHCCPYLGANKDIEPISMQNNDVEDNLFKFYKSREKIRKAAKKGKHSERCKTCFMLKKGYWHENSLIDRISIVANKTCSANCVYCETHANKEYFQSLVDFPVYQYIEKLVNKKKLASNCNVLFAGGEPLLHKDFEKTFALLLSNNLFIRINTSAIEYSDMVASALKTGRCNIVISPDSGNAMLYKTIKGIDKFSEVVSNISRYCENQSCLNQVILKYILIPNLNDKDEYVIEFLEMAKKVGCYCVCFDIENYWYEKNKHDDIKIQFYLNMLDEFRKKAVEYGLEIA